MTLWFHDINSWLDSCRHVVRQDLDNMLLFTGAEGTGKSTIMYQIMKALDPRGFGPARVHFTTEDFLAHAPHVPRYGAIAADEALLNRRKSMHKANIKLLDFLQVCRGLNLHMALCFPHDGMMDRGVVNYRVRWNIHVVKRGFFQLRRRVRYQVPGDEEPHYTWRVCGGFGFKENKGSEWAAYKAAKEAHMRSVAESAGAARVDAEAVADMSEPESELDADVAFFRELRAKHGGLPTDAEK